MTLDRRDLLPGARCSHRLRLRTARETTKDLP